MRGFLLGLIVIVAMTLSVLAVRPGGFRRQLRLVARRFRIVLVLGGIFVFGSLIIRLAFRDGPIVDFGPAALGVALGAAFMILGRDPVPESSRTQE
ncbi:MAG: hypothetical protein E6I81_01095 [Chloroflexi bacterium]|nr:MAG: hypothetical protein E6I89_02235 [Chloroflexota bacterium]TMD74344.1 MAG: hypothetical protein E6I81_01095 [Chloroflexota bacterium]